MSQKRIYLCLAHMSGNRGYAIASPDYETTSQQDNEWGFAIATPEIRKQGYLGYIRL